MAEKTPDLYAVIGVEQFSFPKVVEEQYNRKLEMLRQAGKDTEELETAYTILSDPNTRGEYDDLLLEGMEGMEPDAPEDEEPEAKKKGFFRYLVPVFGVIIGIFLWIICEMFSDCTNGNTRDKKQSKATESQPRRPRL
jgi:DnaJ-class molecular chaperone